MESRIAKLEAIIPTLATHEDVAKLETSMHKELAVVHREISNLHGEISKVNGKISDLHRAITKIHEGFATLTWKVLSTIIGTSTALVSATYFVCKTAS